MRESGPTLGTREHSDRLCPQLTTTECVQFTTRSCECLLSRQTDTLHEAGTTGGGCDGQLVPDHSTCCQQPPTGQKTLRDCVQAPTPAGRAADRGASQRPGSSLLGECLAAKSRWSTAATCSQGGD